MKKLFKVLAIILGVIVVLGAVGSVLMGKYVAEKILLQNEGKDTQDNSVKQLEVWGYDLGGFNETYQGTEISAVASDGNEVPATYFDNGSEKCVILVHGAGGDRVCTYPLAQEYLERGYDVITIDQRGSGVNPDEKVTFGINESLDVAAMVEYARTSLEKSEVIVHGQSMGGQTTALYAASVNRGDVNAADAVILDSPVPGMELMLRLVFGDGEEGAHSAMTNYLISTSKICLKLFYHVDIADGDTIARARDISIPTMVVISEKDQVCLPQYVQQIYDNINCEKEVVRVDSAHIEGVIDDPEGYMNSVEAFLGNVGL